MPNFTTSAQTVRPLFIDVAPFSNEAHHETPRQSEILYFILDVAQELDRSLFISRRTDGHLLTSANTLALCCCDEKVEFWLDRNSKQERAESGLAERNPPRSFSPSMSRLKCRHLHSEHLLCRSTVVDISCNRRTSLSSERPTRRERNKLLNC